MPRVDFPEIQTGDSLDGTVVNAVLIDLLTKASDIDGDNVVDGGLDERNFDDDAATSRPTTGSGARAMFAAAGPETIANGAAPATPVPIGANPVDTGDYDYDPVGRLEQIKVNCSLHYIGVSSTTAKFAFQLGYSDDSGSTWTLIPGTVRYVAIHNVVSAGSLTIVHHFSQTTAYPSLRFGLFVWDAGAGTVNVDIEEVTIYALLYKA